METAATVSEYDKRSWTQMFLDDYELQVGPLVSQRCRRYFQGSRAWFYWLAWDFLLCYFVIGALMVTFWRSAWLMASEAFEAAFEATKIITLQYSRACLSVNSSHPLGLRLRQPCFFGGWPHRQLLPQSLPRLYQVYTQPILVPLERHQRLRY